MTARTASKRRSLTQDLILQAAMHIVHKQGADSLSIRRLAEDLAVSPMAIYRHFESKDALLSALLDQFIRAADVLPEKVLPWDAWMLHVGQRMWEAQVAEPDWISLLGSVQIRSGGLGVMINSLQILTDAGFSNQDALEAFFAMVHISVGASCVSLGLRQLDPGKAFDPDDVANLERLQNHYGGLNQVLQAQQVQNSLRLLVAGMQGRISSQE